MKELESGKDKIKKICDILKVETLDPAKKEAQEILDQAGREAHQIIQEAEKKAEAIIQEARRVVEKEKSIFEGSLSKAFKLGMEVLKQEIENKLFNQELSQWVKNNTADPKIAEKLITALVHAIEKEGVSADFSVFIPRELSAQQVNATLSQQILGKLREKSVVVGDFGGGIKIKLHDQRLTLDLSDLAIKELLERYIRKDFHKLLFQGENQ
jgi:V/A-type H+/Na+-transporting ATPase subunit E